MEVLEQEIQVDEYFSNLFHCHISRRSIFLHMSLYHPWSIVNSIYIRKVLRFVPGRLPSWHSFVNSQLLVPSYWYEYMSILMMMRSSCSQNLWFFHASTRMFKCCFIIFCCIPSPIYLRRVPSILALEAHPTSFIFLLKESTTILVFHTLYSKENQTLYKELLPTCLIRGEHFICLEVAHGHVIYFDDKLCLR